MSGDKAYWHRRDLATPSRLNLTEAFQRGLACHRAGNLGEAERLYGAILMQKPGHRGALHLLGLIAHQRGQHAAALGLVDRAIAAGDRSAEIESSRGQILSALGRPEEALASFERAAALQPKEAAHHGNCGNLLLALRRFDAALARYDRALALLPDHPETLGNRGIALHHLGRFDAALESFDRVLALQPGQAGAHANRANTLRTLGRFEEGLASFREAVRLEPGNAGMQANLALELADAGDFAAAMAGYARALACRPDCADAHFGEALCHLLHGDFARGWPKYEWRWKIPHGVSGGRRDVGAPQWRGDAPLAGKTILLHAEQGFGDTIQFCRYVPLVARQGATVLLEAQPPLLPLLRSLAGPARLLAPDEALPQVDFHCPLLSLPLAFATTLDTIPAPGPYLGAPSDRVEKMTALLPPPSSVRVGLVWSGNPAHRNDRKRSLALEHLAPLLGLPGIAYVSLQRDLSAEDEAVLARYPGVALLGRHLGDFADTAAALAPLDLVITVDTAVAHLAGAMGKSLWLLLPHVPDWRWLLEREDSPWYPTLRVFRQPAPGDWDSVIARVADALAAIRREPRP